MRLKDIIESWSDLPGQHERQKSAEELEAEKKADLNREFRQTHDDPDKANRAAQELGRLMRLKRQEQAEEQPQVP